MDVILIFNETSYLDTILFLLCVVIGQFRAVEARNVHFTPQEKTDTLINPPLIKGAERILRFDKTVLNIGTLTEDDAPKMYRFTCTNVSGKDINLTRVRTTCGCAVADVRTGGRYLPVKREL